MIRYDLIYKQLGYDIVKSIKNQLYNQNENFKNTISISHDDRYTRLCEDTQNGKNVVLMFTHHDGLYNFFIGYKDLHELIRDDKLTLTEILDTIENNIYSSSIDLTSMKNSFYENIIEYIKKEYKNIHNDKDRYELLKTLKYIINMRRDDLGK